MSECCGRCSGNTDALPLPCPVSGCVCGWAEQLFHRFRFAGRALASRMACTAQRGRILLDCSLQSRSPMLRAQGLSCSHSALGGVPFQLQELVHNVPPEYPHANILQKPQMKPGPLSAIYRDSAASDLKKLISETDHISQHFCCPTATPVGREDKRSSQAGEPAACQPVSCRIG